ncbi:hypothetical protein Bca101_019885 [Brassica carinata]
MKCGQFSGGILLGSLCWSLTGLPCGEFDDGYAVDYQPTYKDEDFAYWDKLFEGKRDITILEVVKMVVEDKSISRGRRLKLCLIIIVDGVLIASTQPAKPTPKHVKLVENLKDFFGFQWGRESFNWTVSTMIPGKKILGKCDDPNGEFCSKLRQKTKKMFGLPLALQLLLSRLGGNDELKLIDCERLPQHTGLNLVDVLEAEHNPELIVQPMMEVGPEKQDGWGVWDDEINDRRVNYMVGLLEGGHKFKKAVWGGGDAQEVLYDHEERKKARKRKRQGDCSRTNVAAGPVLKQRRVSTYFRKPTLVDDEKHDELAARVTELEKVVAWMRRRLRRRKRTGATPRKERFSSGQGLRKQKNRAAVAEEDALSAEEKEEHPDNPEDAGDPGGDVGPGRETAADGSEDVSITDGRGEGEMGYSKEDSEDEDKEVDRESNSEAMDVEVGQSSPEGPPPVLVPLKEGDGVPLQWVELGVTDKRGGVVYRATTSKTLYLTEDDRNSVAGGSGELGGIGEDMDGEEADSKGKDEDLMDSAGLDKLVGVIFSAHGSGSAEGELGSESKRVTEGADEGEQEERKKSDGDETAGEPAGLGQGGEEEITNDSGRIEKVGCTSVREGKQYKCTRREAVEEELVSENVEAVVPATESVEVQDGEESKEMVTYLSDSSPCARSEKHKPVEAEANLASLLLAKADFTLEQIVPDVEDIDFGYFETVLQANPKVLHLGVGKYDLDNQFFLDLATPRKWVSTKHMEVLVDYVGERHATLLKERRVMFVAPWFVEHLSGKARAFNAATYKGRLFSDPKLAGFLTKEGKKLGVDVDNFYTPMIWGTNHWVGLRISITGWSVLVLDPDRSLRDMDGVMAIMTPLAKMLPYLVRKVCPAEFLMGHGLEPFGVELMADGYQNTWSGDCGPVAMKFMELHATGVEEPQVDDLTDGLVDIFRKQFAMDVYRDWIVPLYMGGNAGE